MRRTISRRVFPSVLLCAWMSQAASGPETTVLASLSGIVSDAATGRPLPGKTVQLITDWDREPKQMREDTTDAGGWYLFSGLTPPNGPNMAHLVICTEAGGSGCKVGTLRDISPGQDRRQDFRISKPIVWDFQVAEKARPDRAVPGAHVAVQLPMTEQGFGRAPDRIHIGRSDSGGQARMQEAMYAREPAPMQAPQWLETDLAAGVLGSSVQITVAKAGYRTQILTRTVASEALKLEAQDFPGQWIFSDTFYLEPDAGSPSRTLSGTVTDHVANPEGLAILFSGAIEGKSCVLFDFVRGGRISIRGIPGSVAGGSLYSAFGDSLRIAPEDFSRDIHLTTHSPVPTGLAGGSGPGRARGKGRQPPGTAKIRVDALGRAVVPRPDVSRDGRAATFP